jgi:hypothetical protein
MCKASCNKIILILYNYKSVFFSYTKHINTHHIKLHYTTLVRNTSFFGKFDLTYMKQIQTGRNLKTHHEFLAF